MTAKNTPTDIDPCTAHTLLSHDVRADVIDYIAGTEDERISVRELADHLAESGSRSGSVLATLHHQHLPTLAAADVIEYHVEDGVVVPKEGCVVLSRVRERVRSVVAG